MQPKQPTGEQVNKLWYKHTMEYYKYQETTRKN